MKNNFSKTEKEILKFWQDNKIFKKSLSKRKRARNFVFYEGPPTANGKPGIHHVLSRSFKDIVCRYKTMQGFKVLRKAGWDTHGLPVELQVEKNLGLKNKKEIEKFGVARFNNFCRKSVWNYKKDWEALTERIGFWLDMKNPYITYEANYIETVWWIIKEIWNRGLIYKGHKVIPYCPRCGTGLSSHEVAQGYKKIKEKSVFLKFKIISPSPKFKNAFILSWTTTPWTLPGNVALAVNPKLKYLMVRSKKEIFILAQESLDLLKEEGRKVVSEIKGEDLVGLKYKPLFDVSQLKSAKSYQVYPASFVTSTEGTGIVHTAVMYGEDDYNLGKKAGLPTLHTVDQEGKFVKNLEAGLAGLYVKSKEAERLIFDHLKKNNFFFKEESYEHDYPFCWRCSSPLLYYAKESWFINMQKVKRELIEGNKKINWVPSHLKEGRFGEWLKEVKDWVISRERYWGTPLPVWQCKECQNLQVIGSRKDLLSQNFSRNRYFILRHGHSLRNEKDLVVNWPEKIRCPLTEKGKKQIKAVAQKMKKEKIDFIFSSDLLRTKQTSEIIARENNLKIYFDKRLREIDLGRLNGKKVKEAGRFWDSEKKLKPQDYYLQRFKIRAPGGENYLDVKKRVYLLLKEIEKKYQNKKILFVSHELPLTMLEAATKGFSPIEIIKFREKKQIKTGEFRRLKFKFLPYDSNGEIDFHRPYIDQVKFYCRKCAGGLMERRPEVLDVWLDSGSMPFAQNHYPFKGKNFQFPADYISEAIDQTRGWFYTLHALSTLLGFGPSYKNVISLGHVLDEKGEKMSKSKGNIVDPWQVADKYGIDAVRWYFFSASQPGDPKLFSEKDVEAALKRFILTFWNSFVFYRTYAGKNKIKNRQFFLENKPSLTLLDKWILSRLNNLILKATDSLNNYEITAAARAIESFVVEDFSQWYIRRSRQRFQKPKTKKELDEAARVLNYLLLTLAKLSAPFIPFLSEKIYRELAFFESVHLEDWPRANKKAIDENLEKKMAITRQIVALALAQRVMAGLKVRQPLSKLKVKGLRSGLSREFLDLIKEETNIKEIIFDPKIKKEVEIETKITPELREEGIVREFVRQIQEMRKRANLKPQDEISVTCRTKEESLIKVLARNKKIILKEARINDLILFEKREQGLVREKEIEIEGQKLGLAIKKL